MTRIKPRWYHRLFSACSAVNKKFNTSVEEPKDTTIPELESMMKHIPFDEKSVIPFQNFSKTAKKTFHGLRK